jgi:hypothetical protein
MRFEQTVPFLMVVILAAACTSEPRSVDDDDDAAVGGAGAGGLGPGGAASTGGAGGAGNAGGDGGAAGGQGGHGGSTQSCAEYPCRIATSPATAVNLRISGNRLYWCDFAGDDRRIVSADATVSDGAVATIVAASADASCGFEVDTTNVYFGNDSEIRSIPKTGGPTTILYSGSNLRFLAADDAHVYWFEAGQVRRAPKTSGSPTTITNWASISQYTLGGGYFYFYTSDLQRVPVDGSAAPVEFTSGYNGTSELGASDSAVYWGGGINVGQLSIRSQLHNRAVSVELVDDLNLVNGLAFSDDYVFWIDPKDIGPNGGRVYRIPPMGGTVEYRYTQSDPTAVAATGNTVAWIEDEKELWIEEL